MQCTSELAPCSTGREGGVFFAIMMNPNNIGECVRGRERERVLQVCAGGGTKGKYGMCSAGGKGVGRSRVSVSVSPRWGRGDTQERDLTNIKLSSLIHPTEL